MRISAHTMRSSITAASNMYVTPSSRAKSKPIAAQTGKTMSLIFLLPSSFMRSPITATATARSLAKPLNSEGSASNTGVNPAQSDESINTRAGTKSRLYQQLSLVNLVLSPVIFIEASSASAALPHRERS